MKNVQKLGGFAALIGAGTNLLALVIYIAVLAPKGYGPDDPGQMVAFFANNQAIMRAWYQVIYLVFGVSLVFVSLALHDRLRPSFPALAQAATIFGLIWAALIIVIGALSINDLKMVVKLYGENPAQATTAWLTLDSVETGLGGGGGETLVSGLWFLLLGWAAMGAREFPRALNYLGVITGVAGIVSVLALPDLAFVYGLGLIICFAWLGIVLVRSGMQPRQASVRMSNQEFE